MNMHTHINIKKTSMPLKKVKNAPNVNDIREPLHDVVISIHQIQILHYSNLKKCHKI